MMRMKGVLLMFGNVKSSKGQLRNYKENDVPSTRNVLNWVVLRYLILFDALVAKNDCCEIES